VANLTFTVPQTDTRKAVKALEPVLAAIGGGQVAVHEHIAKLSVVGVGMKTHSGVAATLFQALAEAGINIELISTSEIKISVVIDLDRVEEAARVAHAAFHLDQA
jgi:aspartate kinase